MSTGVGKGASEDDLRHSLSWALGATLAVAMSAPAGGAAQEPISVTEGDTRPIQLSVFNPVQIQPDWTSIAGLRLSLFHSVNQGMIGFDWVLAGVNVTRAMHGVQLGLVNIITEGPLPFMVLANASF
jgi:hypothetical protein